MSQQSIPPGKHVEHDRATGDFAAYYDGELLGYRRARPEAEALCDQHVYDLLNHGGAVLLGEMTPAGGAE